MPLKHMTADNKVTAQIAINNVRKGGGTNLSGGLFKGIDQHQQVLPPQETVTEQSNITTGQCPASFVKISLSRSCRGCKALAMTCLYLYTNTLVLVYRRFSTGDQI